MKNVLIIYADQLRRDVLSCYGGREILTPNIDLIAKEGVLLEECYTSSAVCTPSRGCLMTGRYPHHNGAIRNGVPVGMAEHGFAEAFVRSGYETCYTGKWHLAGHRELGEALGEYNPLGFEKWKYKIEIGHCKSIREENGTVIPGEEVGDSQSYTTDWLADEAIKCLEERDANKPFLHMVSIPDPHQPYSVRSPYNKMFDPLNVEIPVTFYEKDLPDWAEFDEWGRNHYFPRGLFEREGHLRRMKALYLGMVKCVDDNVGKILHYLKENELWANTIIVFTTDHGEYMGEHGLMEKNNLYESVYHLPMVISMPGEGCRGSVNHTYFNAVDFGVTLAGLAGIPYTFETDGCDWSSCLLNGKEGGVRETYIHPSDVPRTGIITANYELAYVGEGWNGGNFKGHILFDRKEDPMQQDNLYGNPNYDDVVKELLEKIRKHHQKYGTPQEALPLEVL
ncbi:putative sulfatase [Hungatella effluvii]|uniref:Putative sulfatase n=1 Tax=Hungatella effluvii TaxID=1096246 RepID=A0A2V3Y3D1_9FIRM|nr:sulfatase-like hydrolase/transferase [Hungatella effluvii]PXX51472.1 putative sulfatase [Hungatella effluvii]